MNPICRRCGHSPLPPAGHVLRPLLRLRTTDGQRHECRDPDACEERALLTEHYQIDRNYRRTTGATQ